MQKSYLTGASDRRLTTKSVVTASLANDNWLDELVEQKVATGSGQSAIKFFSDEIGRREAAPQVAAGGGMRGLTR
jgi:hypothetical protein